MCGHTLIFRNEVNVNGHIGSPKWSTSLGSINMETRGCQIGGQRIRGSKPTIIISISDMKPLISAELHLMCRLHTCIIGKNNLSRLEVDDT